MIDTKINQLNQKVSNLLKLSNTRPNTLEPLLSKLLDSLNVETDAAVENANRVLELDALNGLGESLSSAATSTVEAILKIVYEKTSLLMETRNFYVAFYDVNLDLVSFPFVRERGKIKKQVGDWAPRKTGRGLTEYIIRNQAPLYIPTDVDNWYLNHQDDVVRTGEPAKSWLGVPMITRDELIGIIAVQDYERENTFDASDLSVLSTIANQAAIAIANARLFKGNERQTEEALQLRKVSQAITSTIDISKVLDGVVQGARIVMNADLVTLYPMTQGRFVGANYAGDFLTKLEFYKMPTERGLASKVLEKGFLAVDDLKENPEMNSSFVKREKIHSFAGVALRVGGDVVDGEIVGGESVGVLYFNYRKPQNFGEMERNTIYLFAAQAATAIQNARLFDQIRSDLDRRDKEFKAIERVNLAITTQIQDKVFNEILEVAIEIIKVPTGHILLVDDSGKFLEIKTYLSPTKIDNLQKKYEIGKEGASGWVAKNKKTALISDVTNLEPELSKFYMKAATDTLSSLTVPLIDVNNELLGVINLESPQLNAFTNNDKILLEALAREASIAITNRKLYEIEKRMREEAEALSEISKTISSTLVLTDVLQVILDKGLGLLGDAKGSISLFDKVKNDLWMAVGRGIAEEYIETRQNIGEGIIGLAAEKMQSYLVQDTEDPKWKKIYRPYIPGMRSELAVPLIQDGKLIGVFNIEHPNVGHFSLNDEQLLRKLGDHAVIAIHNAEQYEQLKALREIDQAIISASNTDQVLDLILDNALRLIGAEIGEIRLVEPTTKQLVLHASRLPEGVNVDEAFTQVPLDRGVTGWCITNRKSVIIDDAKKDDRYIPYFQGIRSELAVPLVAEKHTLGVVSLESPHVAAFDEQDLQRLETLAGQAVIAIQRLDAVKAQQLAEQRAGEAEAMGSIGKSAFELAHRLGNDLGGVKSHSNNIVDELEKLEVTSPYINEQLDLIVSDAKRVLDLSSNLKASLQLAFLPHKNEEGQVIREKALTSVYELLEIAVKTSSGILHDNIEIKFDVEKDIEPVYVQRDQIEDALRNLVTNAIEVMPDGGKITLRAKNVGEFMEIQVEDNGPGIDPAIKSRIFDLFFSTKRSSGFGLWDTRANALANGGELRVKSQLGSGTTFILTLPKPI